MILNRSFLRFVVLLGTLSVCSPLAISWAEDSNQPYIDHLKKQDGIPDAPTDSSTTTPYIDSLKSKPGAQKVVPGTGDGSEGYSDKIKAFLDKKEPTPGSSPSYTEDEKAKLPPEKEGGAIQAVKDGNSDLKYEKKGEIKFAFGLRYGIGLSRNILADDTVGTGSNFSDIYGANYAPDFALYAEYYLFRGDVGKLSVFGMGGAGIFNGFGNFKVQPLDAQTGGLFSSASTILFHYIEVPGVIGFDYRFSLSKYVQPFLMLGPSLIAGFETRNDGGNTLHVLSEAGYGAAGFSVLMDWVSRHDDWDRYESQGFIHTYLDIQYSQLKSIAGHVNYSIGGPSLGVTFEY